MCSVTHMDVVTLHTLRTLSCGRAKLELRTNMDDDTATLAWLEDALRQAFELRRPELWGYLEAVLEEVLFEMELATGSS
jgi:hypothetical protein